MVRYLRTLRFLRFLTHALYITLSLLFASRFFQLLHPTSHAMTNGDPALEAWVLQWMSHALVRDPLHLYSGNTFYPYLHAIILSDPMVSLAVLNIPVRWVTSNPWVGYNLLIVLAYYLSCLSGAALTRIVTGSDVAAVWGGVFWGFLFYRVHQIGHLQILSFQWIPAAVTALLAFSAKPSVRTAFVFVLAFVAQALVSWYLAIIVGVVVVIVAALQPWRETFARSRLKYYALIAVSIAIVLLPFALPYRAGFADSSLAARNTLIDTFGDAVHLRDYLTPPTATLAGALVANNSYTIWGENTLYIGFIPLALAALGLIIRGAGLLGPRSAALKEPPSDDRWMLTGLALVVIGYVLALGYVAPSLGIRLPMHYAAKMFPALAGVRVTQRFSLVIYAGILILSTLGLAHAIRTWRPRWQWTATALVSTAFLVEVFPVTLPISAAHRYGLSAPDRFIAQFQKTRPAPLVVLHLPIFYFLESYPVDEATYMVDSTMHWARILNGFSGGEPAGFMDRMRVLNTLPDPRAIDVIRDLGVDVIAVHGAAAHAGNPLWDYFSHQDWTSVVRFPNDEFVVLIRH